MKIARVGSSWNPHHGSDGSEGMNAYRMSNTGILCSITVRLDVFCEKNYERRSLVKNDHLRGLQMSLAPSLLADIEFA